MSAPIGPGDFVECVDASPDWWGDPVPLVVGQIYRVLGIDWGEGARISPPGLEHAPGLWLAGVRSENDEDSFALDRFRPIYRPRADLIEQLQQPAPHAVRELIAAD